MADGMEIRSGGKPGFQNLYSTHCERCTWEWGYSADLEVVSRKAREHECTRCQHGEILFVQHPSGNLPKQCWCRQEGA